MRASLLRSRLEKVAFDEKDQADAYLIQTLEYTEELLIHNLKQLNVIRNRVKEELHDIQDIIIEVKRRNRL